MAGPSVGIGVVLALAAVTGEASVTSAWASLISLERPSRKPGKMTATRSVCNDGREKRRMRAERFSSDGAECFSGIGAMDVTPFQLNRITLRLLVLLIRGEQTSGVLRLRLNDGKCGAIAED